MAHANTLHPGNATTSKRADHCARSSLTVQCFQVLEGFFFIPFQCPRGHLSAHTYHSNSFPANTAIISPQRLPRRYMLNTYVSCPPRPRSIFVTPRTESISTSNPKILTQSHTLPPRPPLLNIALILRTRIQPRHSCSFAARSTRGRALCLRLCPR